MSTETETPLRKWDRILSDSLGVDQSHIRNVRLYYTGAPPRFSPGYYQQCLCPYCNMVRGRKQMEAKR